MKSRYGVEKRQIDYPVTAEAEKQVYYRIIWYDTLEEAIANSDGEPIIKSVAYEAKENND